MDERTLRALLAKGERERGGRLPRSAAAFWGVAGATLTAFSLYLGGPIARAAAFGLPRMLALAAAAVFGAVALYCWLRMLKTGAR